MLYLVANLAATAITFAVYWLVTPRGWRLRAALSHKAKMVDDVLIVGAIVTWGVLLNTFLTRIDGY